MSTSQPIPQLQPLWPNRPIVECPFATEPVNTAALYPSVGMLVASTNYPVGRGTAERPLKRLVRNSVDNVRFVLELGYALEKL